MYTAYSPELQADLEQRILSGEHHPQILADLYHSVELSCGKAALCSLANSLVTVYDFDSS